MFKEISSKIADTKIIPVVKVSDTQTALSLADALIAGGINAMEITFRTTEGEEALEKIAQCIKTVRGQRPQMLVWAGTVINPVLAEKAFKSGAQFIVSPGFNPETVDYCIKNSLPVFPGVSTPSEVELALSKGLNILKYFPAEAGGGVPYIKALAGPFPTVKFIATGGVNEKNAPEYLALKNILAVGGSWMSGEKLIKEGSWQEITRLTKLALNSTEKKEAGHSPVKHETLEPALYLLPVLLGETEVDRVIPAFNNRIIKEIKCFIVENKRSAIRFIKKASPETDIDSLTFYELSEHTKPQEVTSYLEPLIKHKKPIGVLSEAGCPATADPGSLAVELALKKNLKVVPLTGPSSIVMSLMASGFNGQNFAFNGYLPVKENERQSKIRQLENRAYKEDQTQIFIEAPYRNLKMFDSIIHSCKKETKLCIACGITTQEESIHTHTIEEWKKLPVPNINKIPSIFLIYRG